MIISIKKINKLLWPIYIISTSTLYLGFDIAGIGISIYLSLFLILVNLRYLSYKYSFIIIFSIALFWLFTFLATVNSNSLGVGDSIIYILPKFAAFVVPILVLGRFDLLKETKYAIFVLFSLMCLGFIIVDLGYLEAVRVEEARFSLETRTTGILGNFGDIAILTGIIFAFFITKFITSTINNKLIIALLILIFVTELIIVFVFTQSRNIFLNLLILLLVNYLYINKVNIEKSFVRHVLVGSLFIVLGLNYYSEIGEVFTHAGRLVQYAIAFNMIPDKLLLGYGLQAFQNFTRFPFDVHNLFLNIVFTSGILGLLSLVSPVILTVIRLLKHQSYRKIEAQKVVKLTLVVIFISTLFFPGINSYFFWLFSGIFIGISNNLLRQY